MTEITATNLKPSSSYIFRLYIIANGGPEVGPGTEVVFDTEGKPLALFVRVGVKHQAQERKLLFYEGSYFYSRVLRP